MTLTSDDGSASFAIQGISLATYSNGGYDGSTVADYEANAVQSGANYVALSNVSYVDLSSGVISDAYSGSQDQTATFSSIDAAIQSAEAQGLSVMLKPQLVTDDPAYAQYTSGSWINLVDPNLVIANPTVFFANYKAYILQWAELAQKDNVAVLSIGNEMVAATKPQYTPYWDDIIAAIRQVYHGELTYSALLPLQVNSTTNEVSQIGFWDKLDFAGFDVYPSLSQGADPSVASLNAAWTNEDVYGTPQDYAAFVAQMAAEVGKPVVFTETGLPSFAGASDRQTTSDGDIGSNSANGGAGVTADDAEQANWWQSFFDTWAVNKPSWLQGVFVYNNDPENLGSYAATNYNIIGKTAEGVVASWFGGKTVVSPLSDTLNGSIANDKLYLYGPNSAVASSSSSQRAQTLDTVVSVTVTAAIENGASPALHVIINGQDFGTVQIAPTDSGYVASDGVRFTTNQTFTFDLPGLVNINDLQVGFVGTDDPTHEYSTFFQSVSVDGVALTNLTYAPNAEYGGPSAQVLPDANGNGGTSSQWGGGVSTFDATPWNQALAANTAGSAADPIQVNGGGGVDTVYVLGAMSQYTLTSEGADVYLLSESSNLGQNAVLTGVSYIAFADGGEIAVDGAIPTAQTLTGALAGQAISDTASATPFATLSVSDPDIGGSETVTVTLSNTIGGAGTDANGVLSGAGLTHTGAGVYTLSGSDAEVTAELQALIFTPTLHEAAAGSSVTTHFSVSVSDGILSAADSSTSVVAAASDTAPVLTGAVSGQAVSDIATTAPFAAMSVSDPDFAASETVTLTASNTIGGAGTDANGVLAGAGLTKVGAGVYTLSGSPAAVTAELQALSFTPTAHEVAPGSSVTTHFTVSVSDGMLSAVDSSTSVTATASETAPTLTGAVAGQAISDAATTSPFAAMAVSDPGMGANETVTLTLSDAVGAAGTDANGVLSGAGLTHAGAGVYTLSGSPAAVTAELQALSFTPTEHEVAAGSSVTTHFAVSVSDGALSAANAATSVTAVAGDTAPVLTGAVGGQAITDAASTTPFAAMTVSDPDVGANETLTLTLSNTANGAGTDANGALGGAGLTKVGAGVYTLSGSPAAVTGELQALSFTPTLHEVAPDASVTTHFTVSASDGLLSAADSSTSVVATASDTAPAISGAIASQAISDAVSTTPFAAMSISDPDVGATESVTLTLADAAGGAGTAANGLLSGAGLSHTGAGVYTLSGAPAAVTAELEALSFTPTLHEVAPGASVTTYFDVVASDGMLSTADESTSVTATGSALPVQVLFDGSAGHAFEVSQNAPADTLIGGLDDALYGGTGADTFVIPDVAASTPTAFDTIVDFTSGQDTLDLSGAAQGAVVLIHEGQVTYLEYAPDANGDGGYQGFAIVQDDLQPSDLKLAAGTEVTSYLYGSSPAGQAETLDGAAGHLIVESSAANETLLAGQGDTLYGSSGVDDFVVGSLGASPITDYDVVAGFKSGTDHLDISAADGGHVEIAYFEGDAFVYYDPVGGAFQGLVQVIGPVTPDDLILSAAARANGVVIQGDMTEGSNGSETLHGGSGADFIYGGSGADTFIGGGGADFLVGGPGADTFAYTAIGDSTTTASDLIYNFTPAKGDIIDLSRLDASVGVSGHFVEAFDGHAGEYELVAPSAASAYWQLEGDLTGSGHADFQVAFAVWGTTTDYQSIQAHIHF